MLLINICMVPLYLSLDLSSHPCGMTQVTMRMRVTDTHARGPPYDF